MESKRLSLIAMENMLNQKLTEEVSKFRRAKTPNGLSTINFVMPLPEQKI